MFHGSAAHARRNSAFVIPSPDSACLGPLLCRRLAQVQGVVLGLDVSFDADAVTRPAVLLDRLQRLAVVHVLAAAGAVPHVKSVGALQLAPLPRAEEAEPSPAVLDR